MRVQFIVGGEKGAFMELVYQYRTSGVLFDVFDARKARPYPTLLRRRKHGFREGEASQYTYELFEHGYTGKAWYETKSQTSNERFQISCRENEL